MIKDSLGIAQASFFALKPFYCLQQEE